MSSVEIATLAAGCFWGVEAIFQELNGILRTEVGYTGGDTVNPTYQEVCTGKTGHAEAVQLEFDPQVIFYKAILEQFFKLHDPTTLNRQGPDVGTQYRSAIFYHSAKQKEIADDYIEALNCSGKYKSAIVTEVTQATAFYAAEAYHQQYFKKRGLAPTCHK